jgi:hypothetical protein
MDLDDLIARLEAATAPDRDLDHRIGWWMQPEHWRRDDDGLLLVLSMFQMRPSAWVLYNAPCLRSLRYTSSIDAAMTLALPGHAWIVDSMGHAWVGPPTGQATADRLGKTAALSLCIAALRDRRASA